MARIRTIKPDFPHDEKMAQISRDARLTFLMTLTIADDDGLFRASPRQLMGQLYPLDDSVSDGLLENWLAELVTIGVLKWRLTKDGGRLGEIVNWVKHQTIAKRSKSFLLDTLATTPNKPLGNTGHSPTANKKYSAESQSLESGVLSPNTSGLNRLLPVVQKRDGHSVGEWITKVFGDRVMRAHIENAAVEERRRVVASLIFSYWAFSTKHPQALEDDQRITRIVTRLRESGDNVSEMLYVVDGLVKDPFRMGQNESQKKYDDITSIFRNRETVEKLANNCKGYREETPHSVAVKHGL